MKRPLTKGIDRPTMQTAPRIAPPKTKRRKWGSEILLEFNDDPTNNVYAAVQRWVKAHGGATTVIGGVEIQRWGEGPYHFRVAIQCLGRAPEQGHPQEKVAE